MSFKKYWNNTRSPLYSFFFTVPLFFIYEVGILLSSSTALISMRNGADALMRQILSALGFWFGWISLPFILIFSSVIALSFSIPSLIKKTKTMSTQIPFGPYLILGCLLYLFLINEIQKLLT